MKANYVSHLRGSLANHVRENGQNVAWAGGGSDSTRSPPGKALNYASDDLAVNLPGSEHTLQLAAARMSPIVCLSQRIAWIRRDDEIRDMRLTEPTTKPGCR
jgi:hypothetical protein